MEDESKSNENGNKIFDQYENGNNSKEEGISLGNKIYGEEEFSSYSENYKEQIITIYDCIIKKIDEIAIKLKNFKEYSEKMKKIASEEISKTNSNSKEQNLNNTLDDISSQIETLDFQINTNFEYIKSKIEKIKFPKLEEKSNNQSQKIINLISNSSNNSLEQIGNMFNYHNSNNNISKDIFIQRAESKFGLDNQFELVKYNTNHDLLIHINNSNDLLLRLINKEKNEIIDTLIYKSIFPDEIREIRYYSTDTFNDDINKIETKNFLLVASQKNELKVFNVLILDIKDFENILKEINYIRDIYQKPTNYISQDFFDLSSCVIRLIKKDLCESEIYTTCWEGNSIKIFNLFEKKCKSEIISKTSCNIKYCEIIEEKYLVFCGCNQQDNYTCANCIDLDIIDYSKEKNNDINFIKFKDENIDNKVNVHFNLHFYKKDNNKYLIICDQKGFLRLFSFDSRELIYKIYPSNNNWEYKYDETNGKIRRLNSIIQINSKYLIITERNTGYVIIVEINVDKQIKMKVKNCFNLFSKELISIRKYKSDEFLALGKDDYIEENVSLQKEMIKKFKINIKE